MSDGAVAQAIQAAIAQAIQAIQQAFRQAIQQAIVQGAFAIAGALSALGQLIVQGLKGLGDFLLQLLGLQPPPTPSPPPPPPPTFPPTII